MPRESWWSRAQWNLTQKAPPWVETAMLAFFVVFGTLIPLFLLIQLAVALRYGKWQAVAEFLLGLAFTGPMGWLFFREVAKRRREKRDRTWTGKGLACPRQLEDR